MLIVATIAAQFTTACHYVDPQCLAPGFGTSGMRRHGVLLDLQLSVPHKDHIENSLLFLDSAGGLDYMELDRNVMTCRRVGEEQMDTLAALWTTDALRGHLPQCGPGYEYRRPSNSDACREARAAGAARGSPLRAHAQLIYYTESGPISFLWDLNSPLPSHFAEAITGTFGLLCDESRRFAGNLLQSSPELAAKAGCPTSPP